MGVPNLQNPLNPPLVAHFDQKKKAVGSDIIDHNNNKCSKVGQKQYQILGD